MRKNQCTDSCLTSGQVEIYRNLHRDVWSIRCRKHRIVLRYADTLILSDAVFRVGQKGRERVLAEKVKNVHAYVKGCIVTIDAPISTDGHERVRYNPYTAPHFFRVSDEGAVHEATRAVFTQNGQVFIPSGS